MFAVSASAATREWEAVRASATSWTPPPVPTTVVVPHPDDEALLFGGLIQLQRRRGVAVRVLAVTDGEQAYPGSDEWSLARRRRVEQDTSLALLGVAPADITRLAVPDGRVAQAVDAVAEAIAATRPELVVAPWAHDHHTDHEACGRAAELAAARTGAALVGGLFWAWHRSHPAALEGRSLVHLPLDRRARRMRHLAVESHRTQLDDEFGTPVLTRELVGAATWRSEFYVPIVDAVVRTAPVRTSPILTTAVPAIPVRTSSERIASNRRTVAS